MAYSDDYAIIGGTTTPNDFDCDAVGGWTAGGTAVTPILTNTDNRGGTASVEMRGTAGLATYSHDISATQGFNIDAGTLNFWFRYSKGKGAAYLGDGTTLVIRLYFNATFTEFADYQPLDNADEDLLFGWNLLQISGRNLNGGSFNFTDNDTNWQREIRRVELRLNLQNANDKDTEDAPLLMDSWFYGTKIIISEGTPAAPVSIEDVETYSNDDTVNHNSSGTFPLGLVTVDDVFVDLKCGLDIGNGSDGINNEGNLRITSKFLLFNQWSSQVAQPVTVTNFSTLEFGEVDVGTDGNYGVRGCQIVMPPSRPNDITVENGGTLKLFNSKIFLFRDVFLNSGSTVEMRGVAIDSCNIVYFDATTLDLQDIEIYNNTGGAQCAEFTVSTDSCVNFLVHDCAQGAHFRATVTITEYLAQDNTGNDLAVLDGFEATLVDSFFDNTKFGRLTV